jgi:hypothetical protein
MTMLTYAVGAPRKTAHRVGACGRARGARVCAAVKEEEEEGEEGEKEEEEEEGEEEEGEEGTIHCMLP